MKYCRSGGVRYRLTIKVLMISIRSLSVVLSCNTSTLRVSHNKAYISSRSHQKQSHIVLYHIFSEPRSLSRTIGALFDDTQPIPDISCSRLDCTPYTCVCPVAYQLPVLNMILFPRIKKCQVKQV